MTAVVSREVQGAVTLTSAEALALKVARAGGDPRGLEGWPGLARLGYAFPGSLRPPDTPYPWEISTDGELTLAYIPVVGSTNRLGKALGQTGWEGTLIAGVQTQGRGRLDRVWESPEGGLWLSHVRHVRPLTGRVPLAAGAAVAEALLSIGVRAKLKWPNDVVLDGRKAAGVLVEVDGGVVVIGVGLNVRNRLPDGVGAASVAPLLPGVERPLVTCARAVVRALDREFEGGRVRSDVLDRWTRLSDTLGRPVIVRTPGGEVRGTALRLGPEGELVVASCGGEVLVSSGECFLLRPDRPGP